MHPSWIAGRAYNLRLILQQVWDRLWPLLSQAQTEQEVAQALETSAPYATAFKAAAPGFILQVLRDKKFPKESKDAKINFLADSLAGDGVITARTSRDICDRERRKEKRATHILSYEFWIECSCKYKGRSQEHACPRCGARITFGFDSSPDLAFAVPLGNIRT